MRVAYVSAHYAPFVGGVESHIVQIAKRVAAQGHTVDVLTHQEPNRLPSHEVMDGVHVHRFDVPIPSRNYAAAPKLWACLARRASHYDVVHAHGYHALPALAAALLVRSALVFTPHYHGTGHSLVRKALHPPYRRLGARIFRRAERTIAVSPPESELILSHFPQVRPRLAIVPNGVDAERIAAASPFELGQTVVLSAGRIESYKQVDKTVAAFGFLPEGFSLRVTGDGSARPSAEALVKRLGVEDRVRFLGRVSEEELYRWFKTADVYVSMSGNEAMPVTVIETLAAGARVVASDIPAHRSLRERTGGAMTLVPLDASPQILAQTIVQAAGADRVQATIDTWEDVTRTTLALYEQAIADAQARRGGRR